MGKFSRTQWAGTARMTLVRLLLIFGVLAFISCGHAHGPQNHRFQDLDRWIEIFENPDREKWQKPDEVVKALNLKPGDVVADLGAGTGYFTRRLAAVVGPQGKALGLDIEPGMIEYMKKDAEQLGYQNYDARLVKPDDPGLSPQSVDLIFICNTYHHIERRVHYLRNLASTLKPGGRVVIVDFYKRALPLGPRSGKLSEADVKEEFREAGFHVTRSHHFLPYQYFFEFQPFQ